MYWSRSLEELHPRVAKKARQLIEKCAADDIELVVVCTYRDEECERVVYAQGRELAGRVLSHQYPTRSFCQHRMAFKVLPVVNGVPIHQCLYASEQRVWARVAEHGKSLGLEWGGDWPRMRQDRTHFQLTEGLTIDHVRAGRTLK